jgi:putative membrane protein insertion efficiency factor
MSLVVARETTPPQSGTFHTPVARETENQRCSGHPHPVARETTPGERATPSFAARIGLIPLRAYRRWLSPLLGARCRYYPTCSAYAEQAVTELGLFRGSVVAVWRLLRCNPFSPGGIDPLESRRLFRSKDTGTVAGEPEDPR